MKPTPLNRPRATTPDRCLYDTVKLKCAVSRFPSDQVPHVFCVARLPPSHADYSRVRAVKLHLKFLTTKPFIFFKKWWWELDLPTEYRGSQKEEEASRDVHFLVWPTPNPYAAIPSFSSLSHFYLR